MVSSSSEAGAIPSLELVLRNSSPCKVPGEIDGKDAGRKELWDLNKVVPDLNCSPCKVPGEIGGNSSPTTTTDMLQPSSTDHDLYAPSICLVRHLAPAGDSDGDATATERNVAFSPLSIHSSLALLAAGARGATQAQLLNFLGAPSASDAAVFGRRVTDSILVAKPANPGEPHVVFGGGIWVDASCGKIKKAFRDVAAEFYKYEARTVSFAKEPEQAVEKINTWVHKATFPCSFYLNRVNIISIDDVSTMTDTVLADAIYFKAEWCSPFNSRYTTGAKFHRLDGSSVTAKFMHHLYFYQISCMDGFNVLKLSCKKDIRSAAAAAGRSPGASDTQFSMFLFLPDKKDGLATMVDMITAAPGHFYSVLPGLESDRKQVIVKLPKFKMIFKLDLDSDLRRLGLSLPFSPEVADLRDVCEKDYEGRQTVLSKVVHSVVAKVSEAGTEDTDVSKATIFRTAAGQRSDMVEFVADHPFTFVIMEEQSGVIVFAGHVLDPTK